MAREVISDEQVAMEVERLKDSYYVRLTQKEIRLKNKQRKYYYSFAGWRSTADSLRKLATRWRTSTRCWRRFRWRTEDEES